MSTISETLSQALESSNSFLRAVLVAVVLYIVFAQSYEPKAKSSFPYVGVEQRFLLFKGIRQRLHWFKKGPSLIHSAFKEHRGTIFTLPSLDRTSIVLPPRFLDEIRELPATIASNSRATSDVSTASIASFERILWGRRKESDHHIVLYWKMDNLRLRYLRTCYYRCHQDPIYCQNWVPD